MYRQDLEKYMGKTIEVEAVIQKQGKRKFESEPLERKHVGSELVNPCLRISNEFLRIPAIRDTGKTTCFQQIKINGKETNVDHVWNENDFKFLEKDGKVKFVAEVGRYKTKKKEDYAFKILGKPLLSDE